MLNNSKQGADFLKQNHLSIARVFYDVLFLLIIVLFKEYFPSDILGLPKVLQHNDMEMKDFLYRFSFWT